MSYQTQIFKGRGNNVVQLSARVSGQRVHIIQDITTRQDDDCQDRISVKSSGWVDLDHLLNLQLPNFDTTCKVTIPVSDGKKDTTTDSKLPATRERINELILGKKQLLSLYKLTLDPETTLSLLQADDTSDAWQDLAVDLTCMHLAHQHFALDKKRIIAARLLAHLVRMISNPGIDMGYREKTIHTALHAYARLIKQTSLEEDILPLIDFADQKHRPMIRQAALQGLAIVYTAAPPPEHEIFGNVNVRLTKLTQDLINDLKSKNLNQQSLIGCAYQACALLLVPALTELTDLVLSNPNIRIHGWQLTRIQNSLELWKEKAPHATQQHRQLANAIKALKTAP